MQYGDPKYLSNETIRELLLKLGYSQVFTDHLLDQFWFQDIFNSFIADPHNFDILKRYLEKNKPTTISRFDFYYYFFEESVKDFSKLRVPLRQLGLVFEHLQKNQMELSEFEEVLKQLEVPATLTSEFLQKANLMSLSEVEGKTFITWTHHSLSEFLAADHILSQKEPSKELEKLIVDKDSGKNLIIPSWTGTLRFLVDNKPNYFSLWLVEFLTANPDAIVDMISEMVVFSTPESTKSTIKRDLFSCIFDYYQDKKFWLPTWVYHHLYKFIDREQYEVLKKGANDKDFYHKGNIAAVIDGMLLHKHPFLTPEEKTSWKEKLIEYANDDNDNGVLQRHSLAALENFKGETEIIKQVEKNGESTDHLVLDAFIDLCRIINPNSEEAIDNFINVIAEDRSTIYGRYGLWEISSQAGIEYFLDKVQDNPRFIHEFLDNESIFNKPTSHADDKLIENIRRNKTPKVIELLKKFVVASYTGERNYDAGKSYFLQQIALIISGEQPEFLYELVNTVKALPKEQQNIVFINDIENTISALIRPEDLEKLRGEFSDAFHHHAGYTLAEAIRIAPQSGNPVGEEVYKKGIDLGIIIDPSTLPKRDYKKEEEDRVYKQFQEYLNPPKKGQYYPQVFRHFIEHKAVVEKRWTIAEKKHFLSLAIETNLKQIDPSKIQVHYKNSETKAGEYTISSLAAYFGDVLEAINLLEPEILKLPENRKKIVNYIPFAYLSGFKDIKELLGDITDKELEVVNSIMLDKTNDARYLVPQTYIYLAKTNTELKSPKEVLLSFITDPLIKDHEKEYALENLGKYLNPEDTKEKEILEKLWDPNVRDSISDLANELLISVYHDEKSIDWRFQKIKDSAAPFTQQEGFHSVGDYEAELDSRAFARPLINLRDEKYLDRVIDLLEYSVSFVEKPDYRAYRNYLWQIVISFIARDNFLLSFNALAELRSWAEKHNDVPEFNWLSKQIAELTARYNIVIRAVDNKIAVNLSKGQLTKWTYQSFREDISIYGVSQSIAIFLSHASAGTGAELGENEFVNKLYTELTKLGFAVFLDVEYTNPTVKAKLDINLSKSRFMLPVCSKRFLLRARDEKPNEIQTEVHHFKDREDSTGLPFIYPVLFKMSRDDWKRVGLASLQGNRDLTTVEHDADAEVEKAVKSIYAWIAKLDPESVKGIKKP